MNIVYTIEALQNTLSERLKRGESIGFVPTMGALHTGHLSLVKQAARENETTVVSIFVNPTQFNDKNDLLKYPRTLEADCALLEGTPGLIVFAPSVEEVYPEPDTREFQFGPLASVMEGQFRPGHFNGVAQVVSRLFDIVKPDRAYFGEKDFQQLAIIRELVKQLKLPVEIIACPIVREADGLAMSSRNTRLNPTQRQEAVNISKILFESKNRQKDLSPSELKQWIEGRINACEGLKAEYFDLVDGYTLQAINAWSETNYPVGCIAVFAGEVRLIDNIVYDHLKH